MYGVQVSNGFRNDRGTPVWKRFELSRRCTVYASPLPFVNGFAQSCAATR